jgi:hypothetical protein
MPEKPIQKQAAVVFKRRRSETPSIIPVIGFKLRLDKATGFLDIFLQAHGQRNERVTVDPSLMRTNLAVLKGYVASLVFDQDDASLKEEIAVPEQGTFANLIHFAQMSGQAETVFAVFSISDWVTITNEPQPAKTEKPLEIPSVERLVALSSPGLQKKLILEILLAIGTK